MANSAMAERFASFSTRIGKVLPSRARNPSRTGTSCHPTLGASVTMPSLRTTPGTATVTSAGLLPSAPAAATASMTSTATSPRVRSCRVRATSAPKGPTPVLRHRFSWTRLSMSGAWPTDPMAAGPRRSSRSRRAAPTTPSPLIEFLTDVHDHFSRAEGHVDPGQAALTQVQADDGLDRHPTALAGRRAAARLRPRPQPDRHGLGPRQDHRAGRPVPGHYR